MDGSKRSSKANAFFTGLGKRKKIALFDTLIEKSSTPELLGVLADSFRWMPPGTDGIGTAGLATLVAWAGKIFEAGILIALPAVVGLLVVNLALGVVSRAAPQLNLFAVGFPLGMGVGFLMMIVSLPALRAGFERLLVEAFGTAATIVGRP